MWVLTITTIQPQSWLRYAVLVIAFCAISTILWDEGISTAGGGLEERDLTVLDDPPLLHGTSAIHAIVTGLEHSGTTIVGNVLFNAPCIIGAIETGFLLAETPADIGHITPWIDWQGTTCERRDLYYNLTHDEIDVMKKAKDIGEMIDILRKTSHLFNNLNDEAYCRKPFNMVDKTPRYIHPQYFEDVLAKTPGVPVIVVKKDFEPLKESWAQRDSNLTQEFYDDVFDNVEAMMTKYPGRITTIQYEDLKSEPATVMEGIFARLDLTWDPDYLNMSNLKRKFSDYDPATLELIDQWKFSSGKHSLGLEMVV
eukprot:CAMPEP_0172310358 /NCGR_PEP_ID=MMETSP1058-20130122/11440_1 /TAXON_ID=83371 /ORGANISM="Detonula confervacea, Strain CCMP 353" /LENGTH=310 /DNA_ID=CAMNT_0013023155 /DNA_START=77 /DNA_END=1009 /DNA_ORIENTATION=-